VNAAPNLPPVTQADEYSTDEDTPLNVSAGDGVLRNDQDPEAGPLTAVNASDPAHGSVSLNENGSFTYTPDPNYAGDDTFTYAARDNAGNETGGTVTVHVAPVNDAPTAFFNPPTCQVNVPCQFTDGSSDTDGQVVAWSWNFQSEFSDQQNPQHTFTQADPSFTVTLTVRDDDGALSTPYSAEVVVEP
jgi:VCBS repeat-containing protein